MENLTLLQEESLKILKQLEYCYDQFELHNKDKTKVLEIMVSDIDTSVLQKAENLYNVAKYLQNKGLNFSVTFDITNDTPDAYIDVEHPSYDFVQLGVIEGEDIKEKITSLKKTLYPIMEKRGLIKDSSVALDYETCVLKIGDLEVKFRPESHECTLLRIMSEQKPNQGLEWDEVETKMDIESKTPEETKRFIGDTRDRVNKRIQNELHTSEILIERQKNRYTISKSIRRQ